MKISKSCNLFRMVKAAQTFASDDKGNVYKIEYNKRNELYPDQAED